MERSILSISRKDKLRLKCIRNKTNIIDVTYTEKKLKNGSGQGILFGVGYTNGLKTPRSGIQGKENGQRQQWEQHGRAKQTIYRCLDISMLLYIVKH